MYILVHKLSFHLKLQKEDSEVQKDGALACSGRDVINGCPSLPGLQRVEDDPGRVRGVRRTRRDGRTRLQGRRISGRVQVHQASLS